MAEIQIINTKVKKFSRPQIFVSYASSLFILPLFFYFLCDLYLGKKVKPYGEARSFTLLSKRKKKVVNGALTESGLTACVADSLRGTTEQLIQHRYNVINFATLMIFFYSRSKCVSKQNFGGDVDVINKKRMLEGRLLSRSPRFHQWKKIHRRDLVQPFCHLAPWL